MKDRHLSYPQLCTDLVLILALMFGVSSLGFAQTVDTTPPELIDLSFAPTEIDVSTSDQVVSITVHITDDLSGVSSSSLFDSAYFMGPDGNVIGNWEYSLISGDEMDGIWRMDITIPRWSKDGVWTLVQVHLRDNVGNDVFYDSAYLAASEFPTDLNVTSEVTDTTPPEVVSISFSPSEVNVSTSDQLVTMTIHVIDDLSGVGWGGSTYWGSGGFDVVSPSFTTGEGEELKFCTFQGVRI